MTVVQPDTMSVVLAVTLHGVVAEVALCHFLVGVDHNLSNQRCKNVHTQKFEINYLLLH